MQPTFLRQILGLIQIYFLHLNDIKEYRESPLSPTLPLKLQRFSTENTYRGLTYSFTGKTKRKSFGATENIRKEKKRIKCIA